jgi:hypothetical protein
MKLRKRASEHHLIGNESFSTRQVTALALAFMVVVVLLPAGARAANALINVVITDPTNTSQQAHVDGSGNLQVAGNVSVANTPGVNVANTPGVNVANTPDVNVANSGPLSVHEDADVRAFNTNLTGVMSNGEGDEGNCDTYPVSQPPGTRFVIEYVNAEAFGPAGSGPYLLTISTRIGFGTNFYVLPLEFQANVEPSGVHFVGSLPVKLYNDLPPPSGGALCFHIQRTGISGVAVVDISFTGHLIDRSS